MRSTKGIPTIEFIDKLHDAFGLVRDGSTALNAFKPNLLRQKQEITEEIINNPSIFKEGVSSKDLESAKSLIREALRKKDEEKIANYSILLINQGLVMLCSIFEIFLIESLSQILSQKPQIMLGVAIEKEIKLNDILDLKSYDAIIRSFQAKVIIRFDRASIKEKFEFIDKQLGINKLSFFDWSMYSEQVKEELKSWDFSTLIQIFDQRHEVVHNDLLPMKHIEELAKVFDFFQKLILNSSVLFRKKFQILDTINIMAAQLQAVSENSTPK